MTVESASERAIVERALRFAYGMPRNYEDARRIARECGVIWPRGQYSLQRGRHGFITLRRGPTRTKPQAIDLTEIAGTSERLRWRLERLADLRDGREGQVFAESVEKMEILAVMTARPTGSLPGDVLANYALALLSNDDGPFFEFVRRCSYCTAVFVPPKTKGTRATYCTRCKKIHDAEWRQDWNKAKQQKDRARASV